MKQVFEYSHSEIARILAEHAFYKNGVKGAKSWKSKSEVKDGKFESMSIIFSDQPLDAPQSDTQPDEPPHTPEGWKE